MAALSLFTKLTKAAAKKTPKKSSVPKKKRIPKRIPNTSKKPPPVKIDPAVKGGYPPVLRGMSANVMADKYTIKELETMIKSVKTGSLSPNEKASQIARIEKAIKNKRRVEEDVKKQLEPGQRRFDEDTGMVMAHGGMKKPSKRKSSKKSGTHLNFNNGGLVAFHKLSK
jgi:hypothetical protein